ncbi:MAG: vitamin K epoxide reductase complex subunit 1 [Edafosvirus sp.]|uniref:vitamin-K-epoxide reductase (warfarin-sensitive) n=1 Tax=Edafosvirus sp. TaxID=2487765 RepID=A0A3G4ZWQ7_9VIRU|nr:MAG: vitamin K epoxide reductase complex subunit 1 [Edafosvirus sp.]
MITLLGICGVLVSAYAIYVEVNAKHKQRALCDLNEGMSCTRVLTSPYARMTGLVFGLKKSHPLNLPNTYYGLLFYVAIILYKMYPFTLIPFKEFLLLVASSMSMAACIGLAYVLYFKLKDICIVCITTYIINSCIFYYALKENNII